MVATGAQTMFQGQFADQKKWKLPRRRLVEPPAGLEPGNLMVLTEKAMGNLNQFPAGWRQRYKLDVLNESRINYKNRNLDEKVDFKYTIVKRKYLGKRSDVGLLKLEYKGRYNIKFTEKVYLFFRGPNRGTYMSVVKGSLWGESTNPWTAWGTFKLK